MRRRLVPFLALVLLAAPAWPAGKATRLHAYDLIAGGEQDYTVAPGDNLWAITGRFTMNRALLESWNELPAPDALRPGMHLKVSDRHIVPRRGSDGIVIDIAVRTLYWFQKGALRARFPIGVGRTDWATPPGHYRIVGRRQDPIWHVPPSIQAEMRAQGEQVVREVPPGPDNPLGKYASHGCMRLLPEHVELLYREARDGTPVDIVYEPVKLARDASGRVWLEVHRDVLGAKQSELPAVLDFIQAAGLTEAVDATRVVEAVAHAWGTPEDVSLPPPAPAGAAAPAAAIVPAADARTLPAAAP